MSAAVFFFRLRLLLEIIPPLVSQNQIQSTANFSEQASREGRRRRLDS
jgi:hypothetical protein